MQPDTKQIMILGGAGIAVALGYLYLRNRAATGAGEEGIDLSQPQTSNSFPSFDLSNVPALTAPALSSLDELIAALDGNTNSGNDTTTTTPGTTTQTQVDGPGTTTTGTVIIDHNVPTTPTGESVSLGDGGVQRIMTSLPGSGITTRVPSREMLTQ